MTAASPRNEIVLRRVARYVHAVARRVIDDSCLVRASALTYTSLLSLVPLLALMFAVLKGLGVQRRLEPLLLSRLSLDPEVTNRILTYIDQTNVGTLGALGAAALITTVISVLGSIEASFNHIWRVRRGRSWWRKATDYVSTVLLTPFLLLAAVALTSSLQEQALLRWVLQTEYVGPVALQLLQVAPPLLNAVALGILYAVMPNRRPHLPAIVVGALAAGAVWQVVQWGYVALQIGVARYNAIYGALAQLPVTLVWLYVSWVVVLLGAELAAVWEFGSESIDVETSARAQWAIALHMLVRCVERFHAGGRPIGALEVARELRVEPMVVTELAERLRHGGALVLVEGAAAYVLARDPASIDLATLVGLVGDGAVPGRVDARVATLIKRLASERHASLRSETLADLYAGTAASPPPTGSI